MGAVERMTGGRTTAGKRWGALAGLGCWGQVGRQIGRNHPCSLETRKEKVAARAPGSFSLCVCVLERVQFKFYLFIGCAGSLLHVRRISSSSLARTGRAPFSSCGAQTSHCSGFSCAEHML